MKKFIVTTIAATMILGISTLFDVPKFKIIAEAETNVNKSIIHKNVHKSVKHTAMTVAKIKGNYRIRFKDLQTKANRKMDTIINNAKQDYNQRKSNGGSISYLYFYFKYYGAVQSLEDQTDHSFNVIYDSLKHDLKKNGYDTTNANEFKVAYEKAKSSRRASLLKMIHSNF
jgi:hypothetical protein